MIAVIADDLTGAAELAGIGLSFFSNVQIGLQKVPQQTAASLLIVCSNSRSYAEKEAVKITGDIVKKILAVKPDYIYKKTDSVLRGHVVAELKIQMQASKFKKALLLPANPSLSRTIRNGEYFIGKQKISKTGFANDPEFPVVSDKVQDMIKEHSVPVLKHGSVLPKEGIVIGETANKQDFENWLAATNHRWLYAGAGDFFSVLLQTVFPARKQTGFVIQKPHLYICGTAFETRKKYIQNIAKKTGCVSYLPDSPAAGWLKQTIDILQTQQRLVVAIAVTKKTAAAKRKQMARVAKKIIEKGNIKEIFIEGGATAAAVLEALQINFLFPQNELQRGVVRMRANDLFVTVKPGSYAVPEQIEAIYK
jgi:uncharacterized protein YgbK (DUF1537 family)